MSEKFNLSTRVISGAGCINELPQEAQRFTKETIMIITDRGLQETGMISKVEKILVDGGFKTIIFNEVQPNPDIKIATKAAQVINENNIGLAIAVGGGSSIDTCKSACMLATNGGDLRDYVGFEKFKNNPVPMFAIPTTAGTGSEVTIVAVMSDEENDKKFTIGGSRLVPKEAFLDPELTLSLPARITAYTGADALSHAIESYTSVNAIQFADSLDLTAIELIYNNLPIAFKDGGNIEARKNMLNASCYASIACNSTFLGLVHAIASPLCAFYNIPHGLACAVLLPNVMQFNLPNCIDKFAKIAKTINVANENDTKQQQAQAAIDAIRKMLIDIKIPTKLSEVGVGEDKLEAIAEYAANYVQAKTNARKASVEDVLNILKEMY